MGTRNSQGPAGVTRPQAVAASIVLVRRPARIFAQVVLRLAEETPQGRGKEVADDVGCAGRGLSGQGSDVHLRRADPDDAERVGVDTVAIVGRVVAAEPHFTPRTGETHG